MLRGPVSFQLPTSSLTTPSLPPASPLTLGLRTDRFAKVVEVFEILKDRVSRLLERVHRLDEVLRRNLEVHIAEEAGDKFLNERIALADAVARLVLYLALQPITPVNQT